MITKTMSKSAKTLWTALACVLALTACLTFAACGGSSDKSGSETDNGAAAAADPAEKFIGNWQLAAIEIDGVTMSGDFAQLFSDTETEDLSTVSLTIEQDGTGAMTFEDESADLTWTLDNDNTITLIPDQETDNITTMPVTFENGALMMDMDEGEFVGTLIFTTDGVYAEAKTISSAGAQEITSEDQLIGEWNLTGLNMMGVSMYGSAQDLAAVMGSEEGLTTLTFEQDGTAVAFGADSTWTIDENGAFVSDEGVDLPVKALGEDIVVDAGTAMGAGMEILMVFSK